MHTTKLRVSRGELVLLDGTLYVTHAGLLALARRKHCAGIHTEIIPELSRPAARSWVVQARVFKTPRSRHAFVGLGDADPGNVSNLVRGSELRVAETRAVNRALRKAYAVGICSAEELGSAPETLAAGLRLRIPKLSSEEAVRPVSASSACSVQDRLKLILRDHELDPAQVLAYARRFLGIEDIGGATPSELARFAEHLEQFAVANRAWLQAELSRATRRAEVEGNRGEVTEEAA